MHITCLDLVLRDNIQAKKVGLFSEEIGRRGIESPCKNETAKSHRTGFLSSCHAGPRPAVNRSVPRPVCSDGSLRWAESDQNLLESVSVYVEPLNFMLLSGFPSWSENNCLLFFSIYGSAAVAGGCPRKQTPRWSRACRVFLKEGPRSQHLYRKGTDELRCWQKRLPVPEEL